MLLKHEDEFKLLADDFYSNGKIKISSVLNLFQTVAADHAETFGAGFHDMLAKDLIWVLVKIRFDVLKDIPYSSTVKVVTYPHPKGRIGYVRDYLVYSLNNELLVKGSSLWCLASYSQRKFMRPVFDYEGEYVQEKVYDDDFERFAPFVSQNPAYVCRILQTHIDRNKHTNNIKYSDFIIDGMPQIPEVKSFSIQYNNESKLNDEIKIKYLYENDAIKINAKHEDKDTFNAIIYTK